MIGVGGLVSCEAVRALARDRRGAGVVELALVMPLLLLVLAGMVEVSHFVVARIDVELAAQRTTHYALAKRPQTSDATYLQAEAAKAAGVTSDKVSADLFLECDGERQDDFDGYCPDGEGTARYVHIVITKPVDLTFDWGALAALFAVTAMGSQIEVVGDSLERIQ